MVEVSAVLLQLGKLLLHAFLAYASLCFVAPLVSVYQERKIWAPSSLPSLSLWGMWKVYVFNVLWMCGCLVWSVVLFPKLLLTGSVEWEAHNWGEWTVANVVCDSLVGRVRVEGRDNLPSNEPGVPAPIYIANHASQIDVGIVYKLNRSFKWIAKKSVVFLPGVGQIMYLGRHVLIDRKTGQNKSSVQTLYAKSNQAIQSGVPMFFFPQGTRWIAERRHFKAGAFKVAMDNQSTLVPLSIDIPRGIWNYAYPLGPTPPPIVITVHKPIPVKGDEDKEQLMNQCADTIYSVLPKVEMAETKKHK